MSNFEKIDKNTIKLATYNPRTITEENYQKLKQSLNSHGLVDPIIINLQNNNTIIGGHQRYKIIRDDPTIQDLYLIRLGDIGWVFDKTEITINGEADEKLLNITLNQENMMGGWDNQKLESLFTDLELADIDLSMTGFEDWEIDEVSLSTTGTIFDATQDTTNDFNKHLNKPLYDVTETPAEKETTEHNTTTNEKDSKYDTIPEDEPTYDETIADNIETIKCPNCGYEIPKNI